MTARVKTTAANGSDAALAAVILGAAAVVGVLWLGGAAAGMITGHTSRGDLLAGVRAVGHPADPGVAWLSSMPGPGVYWTVTGLMLSAGTALAIVIIQRFDAGLAPADVFRLPGTATRTQLRRTCSRRAVRRRGRLLRPAIHRPDAADVGFRIGASRGVGLWSSVEDSVVVVGPARSGKDLHLVVNVILDAPGAVIATSTRPDNIHQTIAARSQAGPVAVFDPQHLAGDTPAGLRWSLTRGCDQPMTAMIRAAALAAGTGNGVDDGDFWRGQTEAALRALLMAAALEHRGAADLYRWSLTPASVQDAIAILDSHPRAPAGWATALTAVADSDPRQRDSVWMGVRQSLAALGDPDVLAAVTPGATEQFDPAGFITGCGTLYLVGTSTGAGAAANLVSALVEDILDVARHLAAASTGARLDPPVTVMLNEIGNLAPLPSLPTLMSEGGGTGICTWAVLQSLAQARHRWGEQAAATVWDACTTKIVLGGGANATDLRDLSALIGDRDETTWAETRGGDGTRSRSSSLRRVPVLDPGRLRTLPFGSAVLLLRSVPPAVVKLHRWTSRRELRDGQSPSRSPNVTADGPTGGKSAQRLPRPTAGSTVNGPPLTQGRCSA